MLLVGVNKMEEYETHKNKYAETQNSHTAVIVEKQKKEENKQIRKYKIKHILAKAKIQQILSKSWYAVKAIGIGIALEGALTLPILGYLNAHPNLVEAIHKDETAAVMSIRRDVGYFSNNPTIKISGNEIKCSKNNYINSYKIPEKSRPVPTYDTQYFEIFRHDSKKIEFIMQPGRDTLETPSAEAEGYGVFGNVQTNTGYWVQFGVKYNTDFKSERFKNDLIVEVFKGTTDLGTAIYSLKEPIKLSDELKFTMKVVKPDQLLLHVKDERTKNTLNVHVYNSGLRYFIGSKDHNANPDIPTSILSEEYITAKKPGQLAEAPPLYIAPSDRFSLVDFQEVSHFFDKKQTHVWVYPIGNNVKLSSTWSTWHIHGENAFKNNFVTKIKN